MKSNQQHQIEENTAPPVGEDMSTQEIISWYANVDPDDITDAGLEIMLPQVNAKVSQAIRRKTQEKHVTLASAGSANGPGGLNPDEQHLAYSTTIEKNTPPEI